MTRNTWILLTMSVFFGAAMGIYEFVLPYYLKDRQISFQNMGWIFSISAAAVLLFRVYIGGLSDIWGRKPCYSLALAGYGVASWVTSLVKAVMPLTLLKTVQDTSKFTREAIHSVALYEDNRARFLDLIGKTKGLEFLFMGLGTLLGGVVATGWGNDESLRFAAGVAIAAFLLFSLIFRETLSDVTAPKTTLPQLISFDLPRNLKIMSVAGFIFHVGLTISHCFIMPLFFSYKFGVSEYTVAWIMLIHRLTFVPPLLLIGHIPIRNPKLIYITTMVLEGAVMAATALIPRFLLAAGIWLLHDLIGAGIWIPIQNDIIQRYSREESRGLDVSKTLTFGALGGIFGPIVAGYVSDFSISWPFLFSGILVSASVVPLFKLVLRD